MDPSPPSEPVLRVGTEADATGAALLHGGQISEGFLSSLGPGFLRLLYRRIVHAPASFLLVLVEGDRTVGFIAGSTDVGGLYRTFMLRDGAAVVVTSALRLARNWRSVMETLGHGSSETASAAELLAVAVDPDYQGHGAGRLLVQGFLAELHSRHVDSAHVIVAAHNRRAIALYERCGFRTLTEFELHAGAASLDMRWTPPDETAT